MVMALTRGIVMVGEVACAVKGRAVPSRMRLDDSQQSCASFMAGAYIPLHKAHPALLPIHEVAPERIHDHED